MCRSEAPKWSEAVHRTQTLQRSGKNFKFAAGQLGTAVTKALAGATGHAIGFMAFVDSIANMTVDFSMESNDDMTKQEAVKYDAETCMLLICTLEKAHSARSTSFVLGSSRKVSVKLQLSFTLLTALNDAAKERALEMSSQKGEDLMALMETGMIPKAPMVEEAPRQKTILVIGECGDGKSTLVNRLRGISGSEADADGVGACLAGINKNGITKSLLDYDAPPINGHPVRIIDSPGIGDRDVPIERLVSLLTSRLQEGELHGLIVTTEACNTRIKLGAQVVKALVSGGFVAGKEKWQNIIFVGTKADKASEDELDYFQKEVVADFFDEADLNDGPHCLVGMVDDIRTGWQRGGSQLHHQALLDIIEDLPNFKLDFKPSDEMLGKIAVAAQVDDVDQFKQSCALLSSPEEAAAFNYINARMQSQMQQLGDKDRIKQIGRMLYFDRLHDGQSNGFYVLWNLEGKKGHGLLQRWVSREYATAKNVAHAVSGVATLGVHTMCVMLHSKYTTGSCLNHYAPFFIDKELKLPEDLSKVSLEGSQQMMILNQGEPKRTLSIYMTHESQWKKWLALQNYVAPESKQAAPRPSEPRRVRVSEHADKSGAQGCCSIM
jgi:energy-coupling factor transporter ATP-binding protein EcfA2